MGIFLVHCYSVIVLQYWKRSSTPSVMVSWGTGDWELGIGSLNGGWFIQVVIIVHRFLDAFLLHILFLVHVPSFSPFSRSCFLFFRSPSSRAYFPISSIFLSRSLTRSSIFLSSSYKFPCRALYCYPCRAFLTPSALTRGTATAY